MTGIICGRIQNDELHIHLLSRTHEKILVNTNLNKKRGHRFSHSSKWLYEKMNKDNKDKSTNYNLLLGPKTM